MPLHSSQLGLLAISDTEVKQQIADTLGKNTAEIDESDVRELLEDNARSKAFDSIGECRKQGRSAAECATSDEVKEAYRNALGVDSTTDVSDTEIAARVRKGRDLCVRHISG